MTSQQMRIVNLKLLDSGITVKQFHVVKGVISGKSNQEISDSLFLSLKTIKHHLLNVYKTLNLKRRSQLVAHCYELVLESERYAVQEAHEIIMEKISYGIS